MNVLFDHQTFTIQKYGGISRYFYELIRRFDGVDTSCSLGMLCSTNAYLNENTFDKVYPFLSNTEFRGKSRLINTVNEKVSLYKLNKQKFDVFHPTYYNDYFLKNIGNKPFVVTFHDMIHEKFSTVFSELANDTLILDQKRLLAEKATKIIAISETTKRDLIEIYNIDKSKIEVVYHGSSFKFSDEGDFKIVEDDYILFVGTRSVYKNFKGFLKIISDILLERNLKLVCAGGGDFLQDEIDFVKYLGLQKNVILITKIDDHILSNLYFNSLFFIFPSLYEGFGIPVLESFASNCPVLLSNGGSLPEVGGEAALYFDLSDENSLYISVCKLLDDEGLRNELVLKGRERVKKFSWDRTFENTLDVYKKTI